MPFKIFQGQPVLDMNIRSDVSRVVVVDEVMVRRRPVKGDGRPTPAIMPAWLWSNDADGFLTSDGLYSTGQAMPENAVESEPEQPSSPE